MTASSILFILHCMIEVMPISKARYIELLVVGTPGQPEGPVNLQSWLLDNNSLLFSSDSVYLEFGDCLSALLPGTLILIYDDANAHPGISPLNDGTPNDLGVYQIPLSSSCLIKKTGIYFSGEQGAVVEEQDWEKILPMSRSGDAVQLRDSLRALRFAVNWAGEAFLEYSGPQVANVELQGENAPNSIALVEKVCEEDGDAGYELSFLGTPGQKNSDNNALFIEGLETGAGPLSLELTCTVTIPVSEENSTGAIQVEITGGSLPYLIEWSGPNQISGSMPLNNEGGALIQGLVAGAYEINVTDGRNCARECSPVLKTIHNISLCDDSCITIEPENQNPDNCSSWTPNNYYLYPNSTLQEVCPEETTSYMLTTVDEEGNIATVDEFIVNVLTISPNNPFICPGESVTLTASEGFENYSWSNGQEGTSIVVNSSGEYSVTAKDQDGCTVTRTATVFSENSVASYLESNGFTCLPITVVDSPSPSLNSKSNVNDCLVHPQIINYGGDIFVEFEGETYCLTDFLSSDIQSFIDDGYEVNYIIANDFCSLNGLSAEAFLNYGDDIWGVGQIFLLDMPNATDDCLFFNTSGFLPPEDLAHDNLIYNPDCSIETTPNIGCNYTVAENEGTVWGYSYDTFDESWSIEDRVEIEINKLTFQVPVVDRDNTWNDANELASYEDGYSVLTKLYLRAGTHLNWADFSTTLFSGAKFCGAVCVDAANKLEVKFYKGDENFLEWETDEPFSAYIYKLDEAQKTLKDIENLISNWYRQNLTLTGLFTTDNMNYENIHRPNFSSFFTLGAFSTFGGTQSLEIKVLRFEHPCFSNKINCTIELTIGDYFGAGISDGGKKFMGLVNQFILQHYRNEECVLPPLGNLCYTPVIHKMKLCHNFSFQL
ncbi:MAG: hypothetical protein H6559_33480 [Lewinellaceae bacterium]|nr:hypothetical protein [Lewinellaceae bacterium]